MENRKQKIEELLNNFLLLKRVMAFHVSPLEKVPRITPSQWSVLMLVAHCSKNTVKDIAIALNITSSATTQLVDGLVENGYIIKEIPKEDKRKAILSLSGKTKIQVEKMKKKGLDKFLRFFDVLNDREFNDYVLLNKKIVDKLLKDKQ